ncbi:hypothetical protein KEF29_05735 [Streptomyces tuirus]|uniref:Restriction endonuclease type IV Mrr domain-containing protein n=1 Tax=Streptomyces tuirus TaxID=68278 RepID=A0A941FFG2_9ACTN|nr:hypothetical protein [Streptomyces tuirus]
MAESVPVRCPSCRREHRYTAPAYPCVCGAPVVPTLDPRGATPVAHRVWQDDWVTVRCDACGRRGEWPRPEVGCSCGVVLRVPVVDRDTPDDPQGSAAATEPPAPARSVTIRTALDAVTAGALYLRRLGYRGVRRADQRPPSGIGIAARGVVALVDPAVRPASLRDVECLWLTAMTESADCVYFSLAGYADDARARADALGIPLFVLEPTGTPRPVNAPADVLDSTGTDSQAP